MALLFVAWFLDERLADARVPRNTELAGVAIGGLSRAGLEPVVTRLSERYDGAEVVLRSDGAELRLTGSDLGVSLNREATIDQALATGADRPLLRRSLDWLTSFVTPRRAPVEVSVDRSLVVEVVEERDPTGRAEPIEPSIDGRDGRIEVVRGEPGRGLSGSAVADALPSAARNGDLPVVLEVEPVALPPRFPDADARLLAKQTREMTAAPMPVAAGEVEALVSVEVQRGWVGSVATETRIVLDLDRDQILTDLEDLLGDAGQDAVDATVRVEGGEVVVVPGRDGTACCAPVAADRVVDALHDSNVSTVRLPLRDVSPRRTTADARELGIVEPIGSFTTRYSAGQSRNQNIQRMADLVRGFVMEPGDRFSINGHVGERTRAKGFTDGGEIRNGVLETAVGGGVSQFATTAFNAAFFAGLEIPEYQMHSLYFSRYPYGREATLSFPKPDLVLENNTEHGVLVWPTYTDTSITVTLFGTPTFHAEQTGQTERPAGDCTRVTTERTRTRIAGGSPSIDRFHAVYRPEEGVSCR
ncbi:MAG TPA: VanW family protein [Acidimicrobiales bacterium]|nr:VanW family protein [Acidimicrobiales bacterium]